MSKNKLYSHNDVFGGIATYAFSRKESLEYLGIDTCFFKDLYGDGFTLDTLRHLKFVLNTFCIEELSSFSFAELTLLESAIVGKINEQQFNIFQLEVSGVEDAVSQLRDVCDLISKLLCVLGEIHNIIGSTDVQRSFLIGRSK